MSVRISSLGRNSIIYGSGAVISRFIGVLLLPVFTAYLTPSEYGVLAMLGMLTLVAQPVFSLGLSGAMGPSYFQGNSTTAKSAAVWTAFTLSSLSAALLTLLGWIYPVALARLVRLPEEHASLVSITLTGCALSIMTTAFSQRVQFENQARMFVSVTVATALTAIAVSAVTVVYLGWGVTGMVAGQLTGNCVNFLVFMAIAGRAITPSVSVGMAKELLRLGLPMVPSFAFLFVLTHANKYLLEWHHGLEAVGVYSIGFNLGMAISIVTAGVRIAWYPFFMSFIDRQPDARVTFGKVFSYYVIGVGFLVLVFVLAARPAVLVLTQPQFHAAAVIVGLVAFANFLQVTFNLFLPGVYFQREIKYMTLVQGLAALISLPPAYYAIERFGSVGAGISLAAGSFLMSFFMFGWNRLRAERYVAVDYEWGRVVAFCLMAAAVVLTYSLLPLGTLVPELLKSAGFVAVAFAASVLLLSPRERDVLFAMIDPRRRDR